MIRNGLTMYTAGGLLRVVIDKIQTYIFFRNARIIRLPYYIRGGKFIKFGSNLTTGINLRIDIIPKLANDYCLFFGDNIEINDYVHIGVIEKVEIGNNVLIGSKVLITDHNHGSYGYNDIHDNPKTTPNSRMLYSSPVCIKDNVWIGESVSILPGVTIGEGSIIGAMSLVNSDVPPNTIAVGIPAKVVKKFNFDKNVWEKI